jgi:hypothetical protein
MSGSVVAEEEPLWMTTLGRGKPIRVWSPKVTVLADAFRPQTWRLTEPAQGGRIQSVLDPFYQRCPAYPELIVPPWHGDDRLSKATQKPAVARKERRTGRQLKSGLRKSRHARLAAGASGRRTKISPQTKITTVMLGVPRGLATEVSGAKFPNCWSREAGAGRLLRFKKGFR